VASPYDADLSGPPFLGAHAAERKKKAAALSVPQARLLLAIALRARVLDLDWAIDIVKYHQVRNYAAYRSHRKRTLQIYRQRRWQFQTSEISL
jgi:hypothetical protein